MESSVKICFPGWGAAQDIPKTYFQNCLWKLTKYSVTQKLFIEESKFQKIMFEKVVSAYHGDTELISYWTKAVNVYWTKRLSGAII